MRSTVLLPAPLLMVALTACLPELPDAKNVAPSAPVVSIGPTDARTDDDLVAVIATPSTDAEGSTVTYTYAWRQDGLPRADLVTDTVPASETTKGENWEVTVTPNDGELDGTSASAFVTIGNTAPVATVAFTPDTPVTGDDLRAVATATDADGDLVTFSYTWALDAAPQPDVADRIPAERTEHGQVWSVTVTPSDPEEVGAPVMAQVAIANDPPVMLAVTLAPESPTVSDNVVATVESADADGDAVTYAYTWFVDGTEVQSGSGATLPDGAFAKHQRITVEVVPNDGFDDGEALVSADAVVRNSLPTATGARIDPATATEASTLTCLPEGFTDADGDAEAWTYAWTVNGIEAATSATLDGTLFDKGDAVRCTATPFDGEESGAAVTSAPLTISNTAPVLASASLSNTAPTEGDTLSVTLGATADADGDSVTYTYAWFVNGSVVATGSTLSGAYFDKGDAIHVVVTPTDGTESGAPVTSDLATGVNTRPVVSAVTLSPGTVYTNDTLTATVTASDADGDTLSHTYAWYVEGALVQTGASSTLSGSAYFDRDEDVYVIVTPNDGESDGTSLTSRTVTVLNTAPTAPVVAITPEDAGEGDDLTCAVTTPATDADGDTVTYTFAWDVDGVAYAGATDTATASVVDGADVGASETWSCEVTPSDDRLAGESVVVTASNCAAIKAMAGTARISLANTGFGLGSGDYTLEFWVRPHHEFSGCSDGVVLLQMNESYGVNGFTCRYSIGEQAAFCSAYDGGPGNPYVRSGLLEVGQWHHVAYVRTAGIHRIYTDGVLSDAGVNATPMYASSGIAIGQPGGYPTQCAAPVSFGAIRFSNTSRYSSTFVPRRGWTVDAYTVAQYLTDTTFDGSTLVDEAGGDNNGLSNAGFVPATCR